MEMEDTFRIMKEVSLGRGPPADKPDDEEAAEFRKAVQAEAAEMKAKGQMMHIPSDWAD